MGTGPFVLRKLILGPEWFVLFWRATSVLATIELSLMKKSNQSFTGICPCIGILENRSEEFLPSSAQRIRTERDPRGDQRRLLPGPHAPCLGDSHGWSAARLPYIQNFITESGRRPSAVASSKQGILEPCSFSRNRFRFRKPADFGEFWRTKSLGNFENRRTQSQFWRTFGEIPMKFR